MPYEPILTNTLFYSLYDNESSVGDNECGPEAVTKLKTELREKDMVLTDIRLEALSSAHQLEKLRDTVMKMRVSELSFELSYNANMSYQAD